MLSGSQRSNPARLFTLLAATALLLSAQGTPEITLTTGAVVDRAISGKQEDLYRLSLAAGECATVTVEQRGIDVVTQLLDSAGKLVAEYDFEDRKQGQEVFALPADSAIDYRLKIKARYPRDPSASYQVRVAVKRATDRDRDGFEAQKLNTQSMTLEDAGKYDQALVPAEKALDLGQKTWGPENFYTGYLLSHLASLKRTKGQYPEAEAMYRRVLDVYRQSPGREHPQTAVALRGLGKLYLDLNEYGKAEPLLQEALEIMERTLGPEHPQVALCLRMIANLHGYREDLERSAEDLQRALAIAEKAYEPDDVSLIAIVHDLGNVYEVMGDGDRAEPLLERSLDWVERHYGPEHPQAASPLRNLAAIAFQKHQYQRALDLYTRAKALREKALGSEHPDAVGLMVSIGDIYNCLGDYDKALEIHKRAFEILSRTVGPQHRSLWVAMEAIARTYAAKGDYSSAIDYQIRFDELLEKYVALNLSSGSEREKLAYFSWASSQTDRTLSLHVLRAPEDKRARDLAALVLLRHKGRVLDSVSGGLGALRERMDPDDRKLLEELGENNTRLAGLALSGMGKIPEGEYRKQLASFEERSERLETAISARSSAFRAQSQPVTLEAVRAAIPQDAALVEFGSFRPFDPHGNESSDAYGPRRYVVYVLRRQGEVRWTDLGEVTPVDDAITALREALRDNKRTDVKNLARALDDRVMRPVRALTGDATQLLISPEGELNLIPFEALVDEHDRYLLERYSISYLTTGRDLLRMQVGRASKSSPLIFADPFFGEPKAIRTVAAVAPRRSITTGSDLSSVYFAPLAGTAEEARSIKTLFPEAMVVTGSDASKASLKLVNAPSILHIATHGFFLTDEDATKQAANPLLRSGLALAGANLSNGDGILTALEAANLNLWGTRVVTLSACETGVGEVKNGEGVYGLRRSFVLAGAETLVMSLWPVSDRVTREIMTNYYTGLKQGLGRGEALRQAQLKMLKRKDRQHPFFWASFIQSGQWKNLEGN